MKRSKISLVVILSIILNSVLALQPLGINEAKAAFPGYNGKIGFSSNRSGATDIYIIDKDGSNLFNLTNHPDSDSDVSWSPIDNRIAFHTTRDTGGISKDIYSVNIDGTGLVQLTNNVADEIYPTYSPDGEELIYSSAQDGNYEIYKMLADGSQKTRLTTNAVVDAFPSWHPSGLHIVFARGSNPTRQIYIMNQDGTNQVNLSSNAFDDSYPDWSPSGDKIVFTSKRDGNDEIYVMDADGSNQTRLTTNSDVDYSPSWSPDGNYILFTSNRDGDFEIYRMNADGSNQIRIVSNPANDDHASWQRIRNVKPATTSDSIITTTQSSVTKDVLINDTDEEALDPSNLTIHTQPTHGTASIESGKVKYTPAAGYVGTDQLTYQICDSFMLDQKCSTADLSITVKPAAAVSKVGDKVVENGVEKVVAKTNRPTFSGIATPGSTVKVEIHSDPIILTTTTDSEGNWSVTPDQDLPPGDHTVKITATLNGVTTELDSFVLAVQQTIPNTGFNSLSTRIGGGVLLVSGLSLAFWQRRRMRELIRHQVPNLFP